MEPLEVIVGPVEAVSPHSPHDLSLGDLLSSESLEATEKSKVHVLIEASISWDSCWST